MFSYDLFDDTLDLELLIPKKEETEIFLYKCIYRGGNEVLVSSDATSSSFIKSEKKSPELESIWKQTGVSKWIKIYPTS